MRRILAVGVVCLLLVGSAGSTAADYTVTVDGEIETPERTVSVEGDTYQVSSIARVQQGDPLDVQTIGVDGEGYRVYVHGVEDGTQTIAAQRYVFPEDDGNVSFDTSEFDAGSYTVSVFKDGTYYDPQPVIVPAYEVSASAPATVSGSDPVDVSVSLTELESGYTVDSVEVVVANSDVTRRLDASEDGGEYVATLEAGSLPAGEYDVYAVVYSPQETPSSPNEAIGISDSSTLTVEGDSPGGTSSPSDPGKTTATTDGTATATATSTAATPTTGAGTSASSGTTPVTDGSEPGSTDTDSTPGSGTASTESSENVITPNPGTTSSPTGASDGGAGGVPLALVAVLASAGLLAWRAGSE